jgi:hypothetical protein
MISFFVLVFGKLCLVLSCVFGEKTSVPHHEIVAARSPRSSNRIAWHLAARVAQPRLRKAAIFTCLFRIKMKK